MYNFTEHICPICNTNRRSKIHKAQKWICAKKHQELHKDRIEKYEENKIALYKQRKLKQKT